MLSEDKKLKFHELLKKNVQKIIFKEISSYHYSSHRYIMDQIKEA
jgi:hypothetical protein